MSSGRMSEPTPERSWRCSTLFHQRSIWLRTMAGSSTKSAEREMSESSDFCAPATEAKNSHPGKTLTPPAAAASAAISSFSYFDALMAQARVDRGQQVLGDRSLGQRQQFGFVEAALRALRFGIELADGVDLVAKELDAHGAVGLGRVDIENAAAPRELAGHLHQVHLRVAHAGQVRGEGFKVELFAAPQRDGEAGVVLAIEEASAADSTGAMRMSTALVESFHSAEARCSCTSG